MNFSDFCEKEPEIDKIEIDKNLQKNAQNKQKNIENLQKNAQNQSIIDKNEIKEKFEKYQNMNQTELINELLKESNIQKQKGNLDEKKLDEIKNSLSPLMDEEQKNRLNELINMLR